MRRRRFAAFVLLFIRSALGGSADAAPPPADAAADLVLTGGTVVTLDPARPRATAIAIRGGRIVRVGRDAEVEPRAGPPRASPRIRRAASAHRG